MPFHYINVLPPELLYMVFDYLRSYDRCTVSEVCQRWSEMLMNYHRPKDTHPGNRLFPKYVGPSVPESQMKEYQKVEIFECTFETDWQIECLEKYLFNTDLVQNLVELSVDQTLCRLKQSEMHLPNLHTLHVTVFSPVGIEQFPSMQCRIVAPKLRTFHQEGGLMPEVLRMFSEQIETLIIVVDRREDMLSAMENLRFAKVRSLILHVRGSFQKADFSVELRELFGRLRYLKTNNNELFNFIIEEAKNLQSLDINVKKINENALHHISKLKWLKKLAVKLEIGVVIPRLSQPNLTKLKIDNIGTVASLDNLPCLKSLDVHYRGSADLKSFFRPRAHQLQSLSLFYINLIDRNAVDGICSLVNLSILEITCIRGESSDFEELFRLLNKLRCAYFNCCALTEPYSDCCFCDDDDDCSDGSDEEEEDALDFSFDDLAEQRLQQFIEELSLCFVDCAIVVHEGTLKEKWIKSKRD